MTCRPTSTTTPPVKDGVTPLSQKIKLTSIYVQVEILSAKLGLSKEKAIAFLDKRFDEIKLPPDALGLCAIPAPDCGDSYRELTLTALDLVSKEFDEFSGLECRNAPDKFFLPKTTLKCLVEIQKQQEGPILVLPIASDSTALPCSIENTFLFGSLFTACLALTNQHLYDQKTSAPSEESVVECVGFGKVSCRKCWFDDTKMRWGKIRGFVPDF